MNFNVISTGSSGNAVVINDDILIDCGVPFKVLQSVKQDIKLVLLTHIHADHFKVSTIRSLHKERPTLRFACCEWLVHHLLYAGVDKRCIDVLSLGSIYAYKLGNERTTQIRPFMLVHDVPNCGYSITDKDEKIFYATDTGTLEHIKARNYDFYLIEGNHKKSEMEQRIQEKVQNGKYCYEYRAARNHLSEEQAFKWLAENMGVNSKYMFLHQHKKKA